MYKSCPAQIKAAGADDGLADGQFRALVSVFGNIDATGDKVIPGAFTKTLADWDASGDQIPIYWSHQLDDPDMNLGYVLEAAETDRGLEVLGQLDVPEGSAKAQQAYRLMKGRRVNQFSFAYDVVDQQQTTDDEGGGYNELRELRLYEVGPTPIGANPETELLAVKHRRGTPGRKQAVARHTTATSDAEWDGPGAQANLSDDAGEATYRKAYAWQDPDADADTKAAWKFIHHFVDADGAVGDASTVACTAGIAVLNGGRGGSAIPDADRKGVYDHLAGHLTDADLEPPELAPAGAADEPKSAAARYKRGRTISAKNETTLRDAAAALDAAAKSIKSVLAQLDSAQSDEPGKANTPGKASDTGPVKDEARNGKSEEPIRHASSVELWEAAVHLSELEGKRTWT